MELLPQTTVGREKCFQVSADWINPQRQWLKATEAIPIAARYGFYPVSTDTFE